MPDGDETLEIELKLSADGEEPLRRLETASGLGHARLGPVRRAEEIDRYLDTQAGHLAAARWACRLRWRGGRWIVSLKGPPTAEAGDGSLLHRRPEIEGAAGEAPDPAGWPPSIARDRLLELTAGKPLVEQLRLEQDRREREVLDGTRRLGLLSLDRVRVVRSGEELGLRCVVELELTAAGEALHDELGAALLAVEGLASEPRTKLELGLAMLAATPPAR